MNFLFKIIYQIYLFYVKFKKRGKKIKIVLCIPSTLINFFSKQLKSGSDIKLVYDLSYLIVSIYLVIFI